MGRYALTQWLSARKMRVGIGWLIVSIIAAFNLFSHLGEPTGPLWDENYYITSTARYETGTAQFASHPPLGLMLIAAGDVIYGANANQDAFRIGADKKISGEAMPADFSYIGVRWMSALFGTLAAGLVFLLLVSLLDSLTTALVFSTPFIFDTALIAQFRAAHLDAFQIFFVLAALLVVARAGKAGDHAIGRYALAFGFACGLATMVRANAILLLATGVVIIGHAWLAERAHTRRIADAIRNGISIAAGFGLAVVAVASLHLLVSPNPPRMGTPAGDKDSMFVSGPYLDYLEHRRGFSTPVLWSAMQGYNRFMAADLQGIGTTDPNGSTPLQWIVGQLPISYRWDSDGVRISNVWLVANPAGWLVSIAGVIATILLLARKFSGRRALHAPTNITLSAALLLTWVLFMITYQWLTLHRVMYLYHYFLPLIIGWILAALAWQQITERIRKRHIGATLPSLVVITVLVGFVFLSPFALHQPLTPSQCKFRSSLSVGIFCR
jgi:dolichyl-phosphate-mannose-protein mannosyltransferase